MNALLLVAHGSRRTASNSEVNVLAEQIGQQMDDRFELVETAFLELATPDIPTGIGRCVEQGAMRIVVVPYFLAAGTHVVNDIPEIVASARGAHPAVDILLTEHIGASELMPALIRQCVQAAGGS